VNRAEFVRCVGSAWPALAYRAEAGIATTFPETLVWYAEPLHRRGVVLRHDADRVLPAASIIKLLIARTLIDAVGRGELALDAGVALRASDRVGGSDRYGRLRPGRYPLAELLGAMLSLSDNTAANALLHAAGMKRCNGVAAAMGLAATRIRRTFYDWEAQRRGSENTTTARESATLLVDLVRRAGDAGRAGGAARLVVRALLAQTDRESIPPALLTRTAIANKTGELPGVRNDVAVVGYGHPDAYVVAVMSRFMHTPRSVAVREIRNVIDDVDRRLRLPSPRPSDGPRGRRG